MNHVAHCLLSYPNEELLIGNFIGDYIKGSAWKKFPGGIQKGILFHRFIDALADEHPTLRALIESMRPFAGRFAGPVADVLCDHLLCRRWEECVPYLDFEYFAHWAYAGLSHYCAYMPEPLRQRWPKMLHARFLHLYRSRDGFAWTLERFAQRLSSPIDCLGVLQHLDSKSLSLEADLPRLFSDLEIATRQWRLIHMD